MATELEVDPKKVEMQHSKWVDETLVPLEDDRTFLRCALRDGNKEVVVTVHR